MSSFTRCPSDATSLSIAGVLDSRILAPLTKLSSLSIEDSPGDVRPLAGLSNLAKLDLLGTSVSDLGPLAGLSELSSLGLTGTSVSAEQVKQLRSSLGGDRQIVAGTG